MPDDAVFDERLRRAAQAALDAHAATVDVDAEFDALRTRLTGQPAVVPLPRARPNRAGWLAAAAAALIVVAGVVAIGWSRGGDRTDIVAPPPASDVDVTTAPTPPASIAPGTTVPATATSAPPPAAAIASPAVVTAGEVVTITPAGTIERMCRDIVTLTSLEGVGTGGQIVDGEWLAATGDDVTTVTYPACQGVTSDSPVSLVVPADVPAGGYELCLAEPGNPIGCARVAVQAPPSQACLAEPRTPPSLVDGTPPGEPTIEPSGDGRAARWGMTDAPNVVYQILDTSVHPSWLDDAIADGRAITNGAHQAVEIPVSDDPALGRISIYIRDTGDGCLRHYVVGPGLLASEAQTVARQWVDALASGGSPDDPGRVEFDVGYFGVRSTDTPPNFAIDRFSADGTQVATLTDDEVELLFPRFTLADGSTLAPEGDPTNVRCVNRPLTRVSGESSGPLHSDLGEARSIGVTSTGVVIAGRDVCPAGTRWGDPSTRWELVALDPAAPAGALEILLTRDSDPSQIQFNDGQVVIAMGEMGVGDISPDGRYVALRDLFHTEKSKWHVLDLETPGQALAIESNCELVGDIVGPPRFVGDGIVVVARLCAQLHTGNASPYDQIGSGDVQVEAIDLAATVPSERIVWHGSAPGLGADGYTRTVELSARRDDDGAIWALLSGGGGVELSSRTFALHGDDAIEITRTGYRMFAFDPADL